VAGSDLFRARPDEPLALFTRTLGPPEGSAGVRETRFEYSSRGDRVPGRLLLPAARGGRHPLVLVAHGAHGSKDADYMDTVCLPWARRGAAVAAIDLPLHGERHNAKLSERVVGLIRSGRLASPLDAELWTDVVCQAVVDLRRALDALADHPELDLGRVGYAAFSLGAILGTPFCAEEPRIRAAALALGGGGFGPAAVDPLAHAPRITPRPVLFVGASRDEVMPRERAEALHEATSHPKEVVWYECSHSGLPGRALKAMWGFLERHLT
jgi:dienelactone hydrolase